MGSTKQQERPVGAERVIKTGIVYASVHHKNTEKVVDFLARQTGADTIDITKNKRVDISCYDVLVFASGIYFNAFHKSILEYMDKTDLERKRVIVFYTCGLRIRDYAKPVKKRLIQKGADYIGDMYCRGYDTFGIFGRLGGIGKGHPSAEDMHKMLAKMEQMIYD